MLGSLSFSSIGQTFTQPPFWATNMLDGSNGLVGFGSGPVGRNENIDADFSNIIKYAYKQNGPIFTCILARGLPFSEARFQFQELRGGRPGRLFGNQDLALLENPWPNATTGELLMRMEQDASLAGNAYITTVGAKALTRRLRRLRPDWVTIVSGIVGDPLGSPFALESEVLGYIYEPRGVHPKPDPVFLSTSQVAHYSPIPDPEAQWRGMSWIQPLIPEVQADNEATQHKLKFFENGAVSNMAVVYDKSVEPDKLKRYIALFDEAHTGTDKAYRTLHFGGGTDVKTLGADLKQLDFKSTQGAGETRIAAAAGVGSIIARFSEGLQGSSLNAGNYGAAKRQFADMTLRPLWRTAAASLAKLVPVPTDARLWYDGRDVEFLKEDRKDQTEILQQQATTIRSLVDAGYEPDAVIDAVEAGDLSRLTGKHSGLYSVQLQAPGSRTAPKHQLPGQQELEV